MVVTLVAIDIAKKSITTIHRFENGIVRTLATSTAEENDFPRVYTRLLYLLLRSTVKRMKGRYMIRRYNIV